MTHPRGDGITVLMVDDDREDVYTMRRAFAGCEPQPTFHFVSSGEQLFEFFASDEARTMPPDVLILDLNLPKMGGVEILERLRSGHASSGPNMTPVVVLTTSSARDDIDRSYRAGANAVFTKASDFAGSKRISEAINRFWQTEGLQNAARAGRGPNPHEC